MLIAILLSAVMANAKEFTHIHLKFIFVNFNNYYKDRNGWYSSVCQYDKCHGAIFGPSRLNKPPTNMHCCQFL
jgi:hypothetical protein